MITIKINNEWDCIKKSRYRGVQFEKTLPDFFSYFSKDRGLQHIYTPAEQLMPQRSAGQILAIGSAEELAEKILYQHELFGHSRFMGQFDMGGQPLSRVEKAIDLLANIVAPMVRRALSK